jgi:uracil-DNA glycosylase
MKDLVSSHVHSSWLPIFQPLRGSIDEILESIKSEEIAPKYSQIFRAFQSDLTKVRCVIVGQDPYPTEGNAMGLAFSIPADVKTIPASLRNIFTELHSDQGIPIPRSGDLSAWADNGVLLLNRVLTTRVGESNAHLNVGWRAITDHLARELGERDVIAILWGRQAQELAPYFKYRVEGVHPSPLSAYRGFFGSKPFSQVNKLLHNTNREPINWSL